jgi:hypothetical protein
MKTITLLITLLLTPLTALYASDFKAGAVAVDITPTNLPVLVNSGMLSRSVDKIKTRIHARAIALSDGKDTEAVRAGIEIWEKIQKLSRAAGPFAINYGITLNAMCSKGYMGGMQDYFGPPSEKFRAAAGTKTQP